MTVWFKSKYGTMEGRVASNWKISESVRLGLPAHGGTRKRLKQFVRRLSELKKLRTLKRLAQVKLHFPRILGLLLGISVLPAVLISPLGIQKRTEIQRVKSKMLEQDRNPEGGNRECLENRNPERKIKEAGRH